MAGMPGPHDIGGMNFGGGQIGGQSGGGQGGGEKKAAVPRAEHVFVAWEKRVDAMQRILGGGGMKVYCIDELRRAIESLSPAEYHATGYYERWVKAICTLVVEKGLLTRTEIDGRLAALRQA